MFKYLNLTSVLALFFSILLSACGGGGNVVLANNGLDNGSNNGLDNGSNNGASLIEITIESDQPTWLEEGVSKYLLVQNDEFIATAIGQYDDGTQKDITDTVVWESDDLTIGTVNNGVVKGIKVGNFNITASLDNLYSVPSPILVGNMRTVTWGASFDEANIVDQTGIIIDVVATEKAFAILYEDGTVQTIGDDNYGATLSRGLLPDDAISDMQIITPNPTAFAAIKSDGTAVSWGGDSQWYDRNYDSFVDDLKNIKSIQSALGSFACLKEDNSVFVWGKSEFNDDNSKDTLDKDLTNIETIYSNLYAYAAIKKDGSLVTWGTSEKGADGDTGSVANLLNDGVEISDIYATDGAFLALKVDGRAITWGAVETQGVVNGLDSNNIKSVTATAKSFAVLTNDGNVIVWGEEDEPSADTSSIDLTNIELVAANKYTFAAVTNNGDVVTWGNPSYGQSTTKVNAILKNVINIYSTGGAFAAVTEEGKVVTWGSKVDAGYVDGLDNNIADIQGGEATQSAFAALTTDGNVVLWGNASYGGEIDVAGRDALKNVYKIYKNNQGFLAITLFQ